MAFIRPRYKIPPPTLTQSCIQGQMADRPNFMLDRFLCNYLMLKRIIL